MQWLRSPNWSDGLAMYLKLNSKFKSFNTISATIYSHYQNIQTLVIDTTDLLLNHSKLK